MIDDPKGLMKKMFVCPTCGGNMFGTSFADDWQGRAKGYCKSIDTYGRRCSFEWKRSQDEELGLFVDKPVNTSEAQVQNQPCPVQAPRLADQRVVCAAIKNSRDELILGPRHYDRSMIDQIRKEREHWAPATVTQGFIDQFGTFLTREDAWEIAIRRGQIIRRVHGDEGKLFSENLY